jgi:splicing factor 3A subunit 1
MAPSATSGDTIAVLEEIKAPAGVVLPPREIKGTRSKPKLSLYHLTLFSYP